MRGLGHEAVVLELDGPGSAAAGPRPEVVLVGLGANREFALELIGRVAHELACPAVAVLRRLNPAFLAAAARKGVFGYVVGDDPDALQSALEIALHRFDDVRRLEDALARRAQIERAKGILMERHRVGDRQAFELLRRQSQHTGRRLSELARAVEDSHLLLPGEQPLRLEEATRT